MKRTVCLLMAVLLTCLSFAACSPFDPNYGTSGDEKENIYKDVKIPEIKSDDEKMPTYFDISLFDEENYSQIYLGKKFEHNVTYSGKKIEMPSSLDDMRESGFELIGDSEYKEDSQIFAGKSQKASFVDKYGKQIIAVFYNPSKSSVALKKCDIVKFIIPENVYLNSESVYGQFFVNGVSNESAITDVIEYLGAPSHFYAVDETHYYLDYFINAKDKRSGITVYVDIQNDNVTAIEFSLYD